MDKPIDIAYGQLADMLVTYEGWGKWHRIRFMGTTMCGRFVGNPEAYIIHREHILPSEICTKCYNSLYYR